MRGIFRVVHSLLFCYHTCRSFENIIGRVEAISISARQRNQQCILDVGTTAVHNFSEDSSIVVGTKKGEIRAYSQNQEGNISIMDSFGSRIDQCNKIDATQNGMDSWIELNSLDYKTKYPIYSIVAMSHKRKNSSAEKMDEKFIFCGSGDRWISVWKIATDDDVGTPQVITRRLKFVQKLGPHTGWVKALVYDDESQLLHSIGCNCIESWNCSRLDSDHLQDDNEDKLLPIFHSIKRTIENCPAVGTTLSSDLLCLCLVPPTVDSDEGLSRLLVSGGVDGRIHVWTSDQYVKRKEGNSYVDVRNPLHIALAHDGRVNAIAFSSAMDVIFTIGNDGVLSLFRVSFGKGFELISRVEIEDSSKETLLRLTAMEIVVDSREQNECLVAVGTSDGELHFVTTRIGDDGSLVSQLQDDHVKVAQNSMIYSISCKEEEGTKSAPRVWVGHASGLVTFDLH